MEGREPHRRPASLAARRVRQTLSFANGAGVLAALASSRTPWARDELHFEVERGLIVTCPNRAGARVPVYEVFAEDAYRLRELLPTLGDSPVVLDIGAQIGCFSVAVASRCPGAKVHAYEASPTTVGWLTRNVTDNGLDDRVHVHGVAVSDHSGSLEFTDSGGASALSGVTAFHGEQVTVPCVTFAEAVSAIGGAVDLVKLDTEGAEYAVVLGSSPEDWAGVRHVVMEYHEVPGHSWAELSDFFHQCGFVPTRLEPASRHQGVVWLLRRDQI